MSFSIHKRNLGLICAVSAAACTSNAWAVTAAARTSMAGYESLDLHVQQDASANQTASDENSPSNDYPDDSGLLWPGFWTGMRGYEHFATPVGNPLYFEHPFITSELRGLYIWHGFPEDSALKGGDAQVWAVQASVALTERLAFIATKDGYTKLRARSLRADEGWNDIAVGLKYAICYNKEADWILSGGLKWEWSHGSAGVLQGNDQELSPFLTFAKGWDKFHMLGDVYGRIPMDHHDANSAIGWDIHFQYEIFEEFYPLIEFHGLHWLSNAERRPLDIEAFDLGSIGSNNVEGESMYWAGIGFQWKFRPNMSLGTVWEFPLMDPGEDILENRVVTKLTVSF